MYTDCGIFFLVSAESLFLVIAESRGGDTASTDESHACVAKNGRIG